jgi:hypothetical protein
MKLSARRKKVITKYMISAKDDQIADLWQPTRKLCPAAKSQQPKNHLSMVKELAGNHNYHHGFQRIKP